MAPRWLHVLAWVSVMMGLVSAAGIAMDLLRFRQRMPIMNVVWPVTGLYAGPLAVAAYIRWGRPSSPLWRMRHCVDPTARPRYEERVAAALGTTHCGSGCTIGDLVGAWIVFGLAFTIAGRPLLAEYIVDFVLAFSLGVVFQYYTIAPMRDVKGIQGVRAALKADTLSLVAFEVGMFGWMAVVQLAIFEHGITPTRMTYWFMMQLGMAIGFITSYPANVFLLRRGLKEPM